MGTENHEVAGTKGDSPYGAGTKGDSPYGAGTKGATAKSDGRCAAKNFSL